MAKKKKTKPGGYMTSTDLAVQSEKFAPVSIEYSYRANPVYPGISVHAKVFPVSSTTGLDGLGTGSRIECIS